MRIEINESESYSLDLPEKVSKTEFLGMMERLDKVKRLVTNDVFGGEKTKEKRHYNVKGNERKSYSREEAISFLSVFYGYDGEERKKLLTKNFPNAPIGLVQYFKTKYSVTPKEVGLKHFPNAHEIKKIATLRLNNGK